MQLLQLALANMLKEGTENNANAARRQVAKGGNDVRKKRQGERERETAEKKKRQTLRKSILRILR